MATKLYLSATASTDSPPGSPPDSGAYYDMTLVTTGGSGTFVTNTSAGPVTPPTAGTHVTKTAGGTKVTWVSPPVEAFTCSGIVEIGVHAKESNSSANVARVWARVGKVDSGGNYTWFASGITNTTELTTTTASYTASGTPTSTDFASGDRIVCELYLDDYSGGNMASGYTVTHTENTALYCQLSENVTFKPVARGLVNSWCAAVASEGRAPGNNSDPTETFVDPKGGKNGTLSSTFDHSSSSGFAGSGTASDPYYIIGDGTDSVDLGDATATAETKTFTYVVWFYTATTAIGTVFGERATAGQAYTALYFYGGAVYFDYTNDAASAINVGGVSGFNNSAWHVAHCVCDGTNAKLYIDGLQKGSTTALPSGSITMNQTYLLDDGSGSYVTPGRVSRVSIHSVAFNVSEVWQDFAAGANAVPYQFQRQTITPTYDIQEASTTVAQTLTPAYALREVVAGTLTPEYGIRQLVSQTLAPAYSIRQLVSQTLTPSYLIRQLVSQTLTPEYALRQLVSQTLAPAYSIRQLVSQTLAPAYSIRQLVSQTLTPSYLIRQLVSQTLTPSYAIRVSVTVALSPTYNIAEATVPTPATVVVRVWNDYVEAPTQVVISTCLAYLGDELVAELTPIGGSVSADCRRATMRTATLNLLPLDGDHEALYQLLRTPGVELVLARGFVTPSGTETRPLGRYLIDNVTDRETSAGHEISVACSDVSVRIQRSPWLDPFQVTAGTNLGDALVALLTDRYASVLIGASLRTLPVNLAATATLGVSGSAGTPWTDAQEIAEAHGYVLHVDADGYVQAVTPPNPTNATPGYVYRRGAGAIITERTRTFPAERIYNGVVVTGEGSEIATPVRGEAWIDDARDPMSIYGPLGRRPLIISSSLVTTESQARAVAAARLAMVRGRVEELGWQQIVNPALAPLDVVGLTQTDGSVAVYVVDQVTTPLAPGEAQTATTRSALGE